jgi:UMF1 family MFS transporter
MADLNNPKVINGWAWYDWANSAYTLTVTTVIFPIYYEALTKSIAIAEGTMVNGVAKINFLGGSFVNTALYSYVVSLGFLLVALCSPFLSGIADSGGLKKRMMQFFVFLGGMSCISLFVFTSDHLFLGLFLFLLGLVGYAGSLVFYNAFLPEIATPDRFDKVSAKGFMMGYIGSVLLLIFNLLTILKIEWFFPLQSKANELIASGNVNAEEALDQAKSYYENLASRLSFVTVGLWWIGFSFITFSRLPKEKPIDRQRKDENLFTKGFNELLIVTKQLRNLRELRLYLFAFLFMSMGVQTIMYVATIFGSNELHMETGNLIATLLVIQLVAIPGAHIYAFISEKIGNVATLRITTILWMFVCISAFFVTKEQQFYLLATLVGFVMGGTQSLLRSTYAKLIPSDSLNHASFFSFYDVTEKIAIVFGTFVFAFINEITGNMRFSALSLAGYFIVCLLFLLKIFNRRTTHA